MVLNVCDNFSLPNCLKQCIYDTYSTRKRATRDLLFRVLGYGSLLSLNNVVGVILVVKGKAGSCCTETMVDIVYREA